MKATLLSRLSVATPWLLTPLAILAQDAAPLPVNPSALNLPPASEPSLNRLGLSYRMGFNISAKFSGLGGYQSPNNPGAATGGDTDRTYDDGYNRRDISDADGMTWNWGYEDYPSQVPGNSLRLSVSSAEANGVSDNQDDDPLHGFEATWQRRIGKGEDWHWGLELAFNYTDLQIDDDHALFGPATKLTDTYSRLGTIAPHAPSGTAYAGTYAGPGALISDTPESRSVTTIPDGAVTAGQRDLDATIFGFRLGPYLRVPLGEPLWLSFSSGLAVAIVDSEFDFSETTTVGGGSASRSGHDDESDVLAGWFVAGECMWALNERWSVFGGVQYQDVGHFKQSAGGAKAELDLSESLFVTLGVGYSF